MKVQGITEKQLRYIVESVSNLQYDGGVIFDREPETTGSRVMWIHFTLRTVNGRSQGARRSASGRRLAKACWHAHRDVMQALFDQHPDAILHTALAKYTGAQSFADTFEATGDGNVGSMAQPLAMRDACECDGEW